VTAPGTLREALIQAERQEAMLLAAPGAGRLVAGRQVPAGSLIAVAEGARVAQPGRRVMAVGSPHDLYGEGLGSLLHAACRNTGITCLVTPGEGHEGPVMNHVGLALAAGATFVAEAVQEADAGAIVRDALTHRGFALVELAGAGDERAGIICRSPERPALEQLVIHTSQPVTTVSTIAWDEWEYLVYDEWQEEDDDVGELDPDGGWA